MTKKNEVAKVEGGNALPAYLQGNDKGTSLQNMSMEDMVVPRVKLLQDVSDEPKTFDEAKSGQFWITVLDKPLGDEVEFIVCRDRKRYLLLAPRADGRGVLARADDAIHWNPPNETFSVKMKGRKDTIDWTTKPTVKESGLAEFGSSIPDDPDSQPAAVLYYDYLVFLPAYPEVGPVMLSFARSQVKRAKDLNSKLSMGKAPIQARKIVMSTTEESGDEGPYFNVKFRANGFAEEDVFNTCLEITESFEDFQAADESEMVNETAASGGGKAASDEDVEKAESKGI